MSTVNVCSSPSHGFADELDILIVLGSAFTMIVIDAVSSHPPPEGVNSYVVVLELFIAGDHEPLIPLLDVVGKADNTSPLQIGVT